ncbi:nitronate monooxygenase [Marinobacter salinexigens]|uniref:Nitronate monooxygenase n=1 Tax=Marinobacter salinexigens TaxID=2919747 RepID=A0A5B0VJ13_9GAMM|nr:nitronate monooxygenase [Marinobacter salinexigens]KAA1174125.1 nitronate monooxygenase [Marinobacter salinexigens]
MAFSNQLTRVVELCYPIIQAPMVGVSTPELAAAVSNAGGLGSIGIGASSTEKARELISATRALTNKPFNVNVFCHRPATSDHDHESGWINYLRPFFEEFDTPPPQQLAVPYPSFNEHRATLNMLLEERPAVVSFHFGVPAVEWVQALRQAGIVTIGCATTPEEALAVEAAGIDFIVAQGAEAGGHRGVFEPEKGDRLIGTLALIRLINGATKVPVIAAGGLMDGQAISAVMEAGAVGAQLGTAFILCPESAANAGYRAMLKSEQSRETQITSVISGRPARGMVNRFYTDIDCTEAPTIPDYPIAYDAGKALAAAAVSKGSQDFSAYWAGQGAPLARELPAGELIENLIRECRFFQNSSM